MASGKPLKGGGVQILNNPGVYFYSGLRKMLKGGGAIRNPINPGIDVYSGFRKTSEGGGCKS